jgi:hypothetical protein
MPLFSSGKYSYAGYGESLSVWSDARGVFVLWIDMNLPVRSIAQTETIYFNDGSGWDAIFGANVSGYSNLTGFSNGPLVQYGDGFQEADVACGIVTIEGGKAACSAAINPNHVFVVNRNLAYAAEGNQLLKYDGVYWTEWGRPFGEELQTFINALWASPEALLIAGSTGQSSESFVYLFAYGDPNQQTQLLVPSQTVVTATWGFSPDDLWFGSDKGVLWHYDGVSWSTIWTGSGNCAGIEHLWGAEGTIYFTTGASIGMWRDGQVTLLANYPCQQILVWGNSASEVFFVLADSNTVDRDLGIVNVLWFNGSVLTRI